MIQISIQTEKKQFEKDKYEKHAKFVWKKNHLSME